jgi:hypothetical protein
MYCTLVNMPTLKLLAHATKPVSSSCLCDSGGLVRPCLPPRLMTAAFLRSVSSAGPSDHRLPRQPHGGGGPVHQLRWQVHGLGAQRRLHGHPRGRHLCVYIHYILANLYMYIGVFVPFFIPLLLRKRGYSVVINTCDGVRSYSTKVGTHSRLAHTCIMLHPFVCDSQIVPPQYTSICMHE